MRKKIYLISGFTLIELLVAMGIVAMLGTASVAIIGNFNRRQAINIAQDDVKNALAQTKSYALSQVVSENCDVKNPDKNSREQLIGYELRIDTSTTPTHSYGVYEICYDSLGQPIDIPAVKTYKLPSEVRFSGIVPPSVRFNLLKGVEEIASNVTITISTTDGQTRQINVTAAGVIN